MLVLLIFTVLLALATGLELAFGATARRRQIRAERAQPARLEGGSSHLRDR